MNPDDSRRDPNEFVDLVAYLDGELAEEEARRIESKLLEDQTVRRQAEALEKTWNLLDRLPSPPVSESSVGRTVQSISSMVLKTEHPLSAKSVPVRWKRPAFVAISIFFSFLCGLALPRLIWGDRTGRLARQLNVVEHLDEYREVGDLDFLESLRHSREFNDDQD